MEKKLVSFRISRTLEWLVPFVKDAGLAGYPIDRIVCIRGYRLPKGKTERVVAHCHTMLRTKKVTITILDEFQRIVWEKGKLKFKGYKPLEHPTMYEFALNTLAHELTHLLIDEHNAERFLLESQLMVRFSRLAKKMNYKGY